MGNPGKCSTAVLKTAGPVLRTVRFVDREQALEQLPVTLAAALRLRDACAEDGVIAAALDIDPHGVRPLLAVADAKLLRLTADVELAAPDALTWEGP